MKKLRSNEENKVKLGMTPEEVRDILGEPDDIEEDGWELIFYYLQPNRERSIRFFDGVVAHISIYAIEKYWLVAFSRHQIQLHIHSALPEPNPSFMNLCNNQLW